MSDPTFLAQRIHGRDEQIARLGALVADGGCLSLVGEAGIGKTRLARWAAEHADERRAVVVEGAAVLGVVEPLGVMRDLVRFARRTGREPPMRDPLAAGLPAQLLPELGGDAGGGGNLGATFEAAARYVDALAERRGALIVMEDLHWADATSLSLVPFLARTARAPGLALLLTYRNGEHDTTPALEGLRAELRRSRLADEMVLEPLGAADAAAMLTEVLGRPPSPDAAQELLRLAGGNPFALEELARAAVESGWLDPGTGRRHGAGAVAVPWTLAESIRARAAALPEPQRELIAWAAAAGSPLDARLLARAADRPLDEILSGLAVLIRAGFLVEAGDDDLGMTFAFRHMLVHEALSREGLAAQRRRLHARILDAAEELAAAGELAPSPAELARHAMAAGDRRRTISHSREAVREAQQLGAVEEAVQHLERALSLWTEADGPELRAELLMACGRVRSHSERGSPRAVELLELARDAYRELGDATGGALCRALIADSGMTRGRASSLGEWEEAIVELRGAGDPRGLRTALAAQARTLAGEQLGGPAVRAAEEGLELVPLAATAEEARDRISLLATLGMIRLWQCDLVAGRGLLEEAARLALEHHDDVSAARANHLLATSNLLLIPAPEATALLGAAAELVARHGLHAKQAEYVACQTWMSVRAGDRERAERLIADVETLLGPEEPEPFTRWITAEARADLLVNAADLAGAEAARLALAEDAISNAWPRLADYSHDAAAFARLLAGDPAGANALLKPSLGRYLELIERGAAEVEVVPQKVQVLVAAADFDPARRLVAWGCGLLPDHPQLRYCAALVDLKDAPGRGALDVEAAALGTEAHGWTFVAATDRMVAAGIAAGVPGGRAAAVDLTRAARERFASLGCEGWVRRADETLRGLGERAPTRARPGAGGLSARELEVLALVAEGLTNRQIAERLVVSPHTAVRHVANLMSKLGAPSRAAAVKVAAERGLLGGDMATREGHE